MQYRKLGNSGILVSEIGLGTNNFGRRLDFKESEKITHHCLDLGINLLDTADMYSAGVSEEYIGRATKEKRDKYIIATKVGMKWEEGINRGGLSSVHIKRSVEQSLKRLQSDYIDLYQTHIFDPLTNQEETLKALNDLVSEGKVRYIGCSNYMSWEIVEGIQIAKNNAWSEFITIQPEFSMFERDVESELLFACDKYNIGILPYFPLASGFLTGKYKRNSMPKGARLSSNQHSSWSEKWLTEENFNIIEDLEKWAQSRGITMVQLAFSWLLAKKSVSSVIAGATSIEQLKTNANASGINLSESDIDEIDKILPKRNKEGIGNIPRRVMNKA